MAAPLGFKTFATGDVLTAADTNGYLMQGVWTFANSAARTAAVTSPQEGNVSFLKDTNSLEIYDGASWVSYGGGDITGVTAGTGISGGGTSGDVTITNSMATAIDAKGDLIAGTGADAFSRLAVGSNDQVLIADSSTATGLKWGTPASGGMTLLSTTTASGSSTSISVTSTGYNYLYLNIYGIYSSSASEINLQLNSDTANTYSSSWWGRDGSGGNILTSSSGVNAFRLTGGNTCQASNIENSTQILIHNPTNTASYPKNVSCYSTTFNSSGARQFFSTFGSKVSVGAITSIQILTTAGSWGAGTIQIYGVK